MPKLIVTHINPDLDAIVSVWLIRRFFPTWKESELFFVPAGKTFRNSTPDDDPDIIHVDTGFGKFDHHQTDQNICAATLVYKEVKKRHHLSDENQEVLERLLAVVLEIDHGRDVDWKVKNYDTFEFMISNFSGNLSFSGNQSSLKKIEYLLPIIDGIFQSIQNKINAEKEIKKGVKFLTPWGRGIAIETSIDEVLTLGEKKGYALVIKKHPKDGHVRIFGRYDKKIDLTKAYKSLTTKDPNASWFLHPSKCLLLNGSRSDPDMVPTKLTLKEIIKILSV